MSTNLLLANSELLHAFGHSGTGLEVRVCQHAMCILTMARAGSIVYVIVKRQENVTERMDKRSPSTAELSSGLAMVIYIVLKLGSVDTLVQILRHVRSAMQHVRLYRDQPSTPGRGGLPAAAELEQMRARSEDAPVHSTKVVQNTISLFE